MTYYIVLVYAIEWLLMCAVLHIGVNRLDYRCVEYSSIEWVSYSQLLIIIIVAIMVFHLYVIYASKNTLTNMSYCFLSY